MSDKISFDKKDLICQMCKEPFYEPIFIPTCGHHCCRECLINIVKLEPKIDNRKCVICRTRSPDFFNITYILNTKINYLLQNMVMDNYSVECENGCGYKLLDYQQDTHNDNCINFPIICPNNNYGCFKKIPKKDIYAHLEDCEYHACIGRRYGCRVVDTKLNLIEHQEICQNKIIGQNIENKLIENFNSYIDDKIRKYNDKFQKKHNLLNSKIYEQNKKMLKLSSQINKMKEKLELYNIIPTTDNLTINDNNINNNQTNTRTNSHNNTHYNTHNNTHANTHTQNTNGTNNINTTYQNDNNYELYLTEEEYETDNDFNINNNDNLNSSLNSLENNTSNSTSNTTSNSTSNAISNTTSNSTSNSTSNAISNTISNIIPNIIPNTIPNTMSNTTSNNNTIIRRHTLDPLIINVSNQNYNRQNLLNSILNRIDTDINTILNDTQNNNSSNNDGNNNYNTFTDT